ncbi:MAG: protoporphyrinogen oxidase [Coriobacteriaceae bacterium]|nr:protoporphyrinogen oxidase [Coriobacteriaceae bacterium]
MGHVVVIGGGVAGLGAAYKIGRAADEGHDVSFTLLEKDGRLGGKIVSERTGDGFVVDGGPDCFLTEKPAVHRIAKLTGIESGKLPTDDSRKKTWILSRGRLHEMPDGVMMFAPTKFVPFATTSLFSWPGKLRMAGDLIIPPKGRWAPGDTAAEHDETLESFVVRRMGRECLDRLAEPLVGGVHASDPAQMSLAATFPRLLQMEQDHGSLMKAFIVARKKVEQMRRKYPPDPKNPRTFFTSFKTGMQELTDAMADAAGRESMRTGAEVSAIERRGEGWTVHLAGGETIEADGVIVATEGWAAARLLSSVDTAMGAALSAIPHSSSATISLAFDTEDVGFDLNAFGVLCPLIEHRALMACTLSSTKWPGRAPGGKTLVRGFVGGPHNQAIMENSDDALVETVVREFRDILGLKADPTWSRVFRWDKGMPQYTMGHLDRVALVESTCAGIPGLGVGGGSYTGVGVPNCIESGERAARKVMGVWGVDMSEDHEEPKRHY